jgi:hypothetical protein
MARKQPYPRNSESAKLDYEPVNAWDSRSGEASKTTNRQNTDPVKDNMYEGGDDQPHPFRHLGKKA